MGTAETLLVIGAVAVGGWYVINYVLPNLPGGYGGGQFVEGEIGGSTSTPTPGPFPDNTCKMGNNGGTCYRAKACATSKPYNGVSYRNKSVTWCVKGPCQSAQAAWNSLFKCVNSTPKPAAAPKVTNCPGSSPNCRWDCKNAYCWTSTACGKTHTSCTSQGQSSNRATGCSVARNRFLGAWGNCGNSGVPFSQPPPKSTPGLSCTCAAGYVRDTQGTNATRCVCRPKPANPGGYCLGLQGATLNACVAAHS
jgi:hypothetical protein